MKSQYLLSLFLVTVMSKLAHAVPNPSNQTAELKKQKVLVQPVAQPSFFEPKNVERVSEMASSLQEEIEAPAADLEMAN